LAHAEVPVKEWEVDGLERVSGGRMGVELGVNRYIEKARLTRFVTAVQTIAVVIIYASKKDFLASIKAVELFVMIFEVKNTIGWLNASDSFSQAIYTVDENYE